MSPVDYLYCAPCDGKRLFEMPECPDGHGADCPDRACVECGTAIYLDVVVTRRSGDTEAGSFPASAQVA
jgi:hypothetical protein